MNLNGYSKITIPGQAANAAFTGATPEFKGLYKRGLPDECPSDHFQDTTNMAFQKRGEMQTRFGFGASAAYTHPVKRMFQATPLSGGHVLTLDNSANLYSDLGGVLLHIAGMTDFVGLNMFGKTFISPVGVAYPNNILYVWDGTNPPRQAAGLPPQAGSGFAAADGAAGNVTAGIHKFGVAYITNTGFTTRIGPEAAGVFSPPSLNAAGGKKVNLTGIPIGPTGTVSRQIFVTKSGLSTYFYAPGGLINDNVSTTLTIDFLDTDLAVDASNLFNLLDTIRTVGDLDKYHGRMIVIGGDAGQNSLLLVSKSGQPEAFDNVTGFIQIPTENDGNEAAGIFMLRDILYVTKSVGIYAPTDNGQEPSSWIVTPIDGGTGSVNYGISTITGSQAHLAANQAALLSDIGGLFLFDGVVRRPPLTYKVEDVWKAAVNDGTLGTITVFMDPFSETIYVLLGLTSTLLVGNYSEGLNPDEIKWTTFNMPHTAQSICMANFNDGDDQVYSLRIGYSGVNGLFKYESKFTSDAGGAAIQGQLKSHLLSFATGAISVFRFLRFRVLKSQGGGTVNLVINLISEDGVTTTVPPVIAISNVPGKEYQREINFMTEKMSLLVLTSDTTGGFIFQRADVFGKELFSARPG